MASVENGNGNLKQREQMFVDAWHDRCPYENERCTHKLDDVHPFRAICCEQIVLLEIPSQKFPGGRGRGAGYVVVKALREPTRAIVCIATAYGER